VLSLKNELSDFLKIAYKYNKVKDVTEAFEEYPVEEEWHKGKIEIFLNEETEKYNTYNVGDIVFVERYSYQNGKQGQNHLFVIIDQNNIVVPIENFGMLISSKLEKLKYKSNKLLRKDTENGLNRDSIVKTDEIYKILSSQILFKIGSVDLNTIKEYKNEFYNNLSEV